MQNKKPRGTRIYMLPQKEMSYQHDIYSLGVICIVLLYKNIKLLSILYPETISKTKKKIIQTLQYLKNKIEKISNKKKMIDLCYRYLKDEPLFLLDLLDSFDHCKQLILDCIESTYSIQELYTKYYTLL